MEEGVTIATTSTKPDASRTLWTKLVFVAFLMPVSIDTFGVNYSFLLFPIVHMLVTGKLQRPPGVVLPWMALYTLIFIVAAAYQHEFINEGLRRTVSFVLFTSIFAWAFVKIDPAMIRSFKSAL